MEIFGVNWLNAMSLEFWEFDHKETKYTDTIEVRAEIVQRIIAIAGNSKGITEKPIILKYFSPNG